MYLGIDLGTSGVKAVLLDDTHTLCAVADAPLSIQHPQALWSEQHPAHWWEALEKVVAALRSTHPATWRAVRAIGLSGQMHGAVLLDEQRQVLRPAMLWNDGRAALECAALEAAVPDMRRITGNMAMAGFTAPKLLWVRQHEPQLFARVDKVLLPKDWLRLRLTGECVSDMSDASGTLWLDVAQRAWSPPMLEACGLTFAQMPALVEGSAKSGSLLPELALRWGLAPHIAVAGGGGDNAASAVGIGAVQAGQGFVSLGTSGVIFRVNQQYQPAPALAVHAFAHALPGRWHQMSVMLSAAQSLAWITRMTGAASEAELDRQVAILPKHARQDSPLFLPYLNGERTPHNNPLASGAFVGLREHHGPADLAYAVMEGVCFGLMDGWAAMGGDGSAPKPLALVGGGSRSNTWAQLISSGLGVELQRPLDATHAAAVGAARLAWLAAGGSESQVCVALPMRDTFRPDASQALQMAPRYQRFKALYGALAFSGAAITIP